MKITSGKVVRPQRVLIYGQEGVGKSTLAASFPKPLFVDVEDGSAHLDVDRAPRPTTWPEFMAIIDELMKDCLGYSTLVVDTADWLEDLCRQEVLRRCKKPAIEDIGYGKGYVYLAEQWAAMLQKIAVLNANINVVLVAHAQIRRFDEPDQVDSYDRYELKLTGKVKNNLSAMTKEWADMVLFCKYNTIVTESSNGKRKADGSKRVMYTNHSASWDAKNRHGLPDPLNMEFAPLAPHIPLVGKGTLTMVPPPPVATPPPPVATPPPTTEAPPVDPPPPVEETKKEATPPPAEPSVAPEVPQTSDPKPQAKDVPAKHTKLAELMKKDGITDAELQAVVASKGVYSLETPIDIYEEAFVRDALIPAWERIATGIKTNRKG